MKFHLAVKSFLTAFIVCTAPIFSDHTTPRYHESSECQVMEHLIAENSTEEALVYALSLKDDIFQSLALYDLSTSYLSKRNLEAAFEIISQMKDPSVQDMALTGLMLVHLKLNNREKALEIAQLINSKDLRESYLERYKAFE